MATKKLRIGIIGCGFIANQKHLPGLSVIDEVELVAFCDLIREKAEESCKKYGAEGAKVYVDYKELLADETIDVVHVCTPNRSHSFITVDALEAGKHVMCEKPMAINSAEALKMVEAAKRTGKTLTIGYQNRQRNDIQFLRSKADEGFFGDIYYARAIAIRRRGVPNWGVFTNEYEQGGGPLIDIGTHSLDLSLWLMNNYKPKYCVGQTFAKLRNLPLEGDGDWDPTDMTTEDSAFGFVVMEDGAVISVEASWAINMFDAMEATCVLAGTRGGADLMNGIRLNGTVDGKRYTEVFPYDAYEAPLMGSVTASDDEDVEIEGNAEARQWIDALLNGTAPCVLPEQALCVTRILEGIYESAKTGMPYFFE